MELLRRPYLQTWLLAAAAASLVAVLLRVVGVLPPGPGDKAYNAVEFLVVIVCGLRARASMGSERTAWAVLTVGLLGYAAGDVYYTVALEDLDAPPYPSWSDAGYLSIFPAAYGALVLLLRARAGRVSSVLWLDGLVCGLTIAAVGAALVFGVVASTEGTFATVATNLAYPLGDLMLLAFVIAVMAITGWRVGAAWALLGAAFAIWAVGDVIYLYQAAKGTYQDYTLLDLTWPGAYLLMGAAACLPARRLDARRLRGGLLVLPATFTLVALGLLVADHYVRLNHVAIWLACGAIVAAVVRFALTFRENLRTLGVSETEALTDALTGLGNRRALLLDLERAIRDARPGRGAVLATFDLDGFKAYNDSFGHPAGDALLVRLGHNLAAEIGGLAHAYRMGGDEFCVLATHPDIDPERLVKQATAALSERGERFTIGCSAGVVLIPTEVADAADALRLCDQRMYAAKGRGRRTADEAVHHVLLRVAAEHDGDLREHVDDVAQLAEAVGEQLGLDSADLLDLRRAAALHDIGKIAIPDAILHAPRALDEAEWQYMRQHTIIGERIIGATPGLQTVGRIVRSSHERYDGNGYPDGLAGEEIPLAARIVAACDTYDAIVTDRAYRAGRSPEEAITEIQRCAGTQFDPCVVDALTTALERLRRREPAAHVR
ncbi:diguanylate cyclase [Solirubrobacter sp. CPCC 204708]|uniref:Diguanylate cyclase n=1 Tax=Solirubrobacter deserti TaxID=2282478 RepID=A0ABT4RP97_9ACTN|nr:diguanylate cyclase [Solirubrobacter deserti]MBE2315721.1 diguanylate cyclase [Solirubrobacter deserti]MDA0140389.1 diguanylate cyclase [Solirubrobacter deserti]